MGFDRNYRLAGAMVAAACCGVLGASVGAAEPDTVIGKYTLGEVIVRSEPVTGVEDIARVERITAEDIRRLGASSLSEALLLVPGMYLRTGPEGVSRVDIRGLRSRHVIFLLDGIPVNSTYDGQFNPDVVPVENIAEIKVSYSNSSVLYGNGNLGGVVNIITKQGTEGVHGSVQASGGDGGMLDNRMNFSWRENKLSLFVSASLRQQDHTELSSDFRGTAWEDGDERENSDSRRGSFFTSLNYEFTPDMQVGVEWAHVQGEYGLPPTTTTGGIFASNIKYERVDDYVSDSLSASTRLNLSENVELKGSVFYNRLTEFRTGYDNGSYTTTLQNKSYIEDNEQQNYGTQWILALFDELWGRLSLGLTFNEDAFAMDYKERNKKGEWVPAEYERNTQNLSGAVEYEFSPVDRLQLVLGYGYNWFQKDDGAHEDCSTWLAGAAYDLTESTQLHAAVSRKIRFPSVRQLYEAKEGNTELGAESSYNYELGLRQALGKHVNFDVTAFVNDVRDYIEKDVNDINQNHDHYLFYGLETTLTAKPVDRWFIRAGYTLTKSEDRSDGSDRDELQYRPEHKITLENRVMITSALSLDMTVARIATQYYYSKNAPLVKDRLGDYTVVDIKLNYSVQEDRLRAFAGVSNLFDENYEQSYGIPRPGRQIFGGLEVVF